MNDRHTVFVRVIATSCVLLALFMILAAVAFFNGRKMERDSVLISTDAVPGSIDAHALRGAISRSVGYAMLAEMTDSAATRESALKISRQALADFDAAFASYQTTIRIDPVQDRKLTDDLSAKSAMFRTQLTAYIGQIGARDRSAQSLFFERDVLPAYTAVLQSAESLLSYNHGNTLAYAKRIGGSIQNLHWTILVVLILAALCMVILVTNVATRRRQVQEIAESERRLSLVLDNLFAHVSVMNPDGTLVEVNRAALQSARLDRALVIGRKLHETPWWSYSAESQTRLQRALRLAAEGQTVRFDTEIQTSAEHRLTVDFGCGPLRDTSGRVMLLVATAVDISERKKLEEQFLRAQRMEAIGTLASGLAHDLNNILAPMLMAAGMLKMKLDAPRDRDIVTMIEGSAQRGAGIIRQLLTFGRELDGVRSNVQLGKLVKDLAQIVQETFPRNIQFEKNTPTETWSIAGDATQLHQVLLNLCINARDAMPRGGRLSVVLENVELDEEQVKPHHPASPGRFVRLTVSDTGDGIPRVIIDRIFDPFFTTKPVGKGTGLGLSSVLGIVKGHQGFLTVESEPGKGTTFRVYLPAGQLPEEKPALAADDLLPRGEGEMILLVDDEVAMRNATGDLLRLHNYRVVTAANGEEAVRAFVAHRDQVQLVLTDLDMPVMGGPELIRSLRVLQPTIGFIVLTGSAHAEQRDEMKGLEIAETISKPFPPARLLHAIRAALRSTPRPTASLTGLS